MNSTNTHIVVEAYNDIDRIHSIEEQRRKTMSDPKYIQWCKDMKVSTLYTSRELIHNANALMKQYTHKIGFEG
jgi:hypothetical protein